MPKKPVIGILTQDNIHWKEGRPLKLFSNIPDGYGFVNSTYIKWLKKAGASIYVIPLKTTNDNLTVLLKNLSGLHFPGAVSLAAKPEYARLMIHALTEVRDGKSKIPIFGTCMGQQAIANVFTNDFNLLVDVDRTNPNATNPAILPLNLNESSYGGRLLRNFRSKLNDVEKKKLLADTQVNLHLHVSAVLPRVITKESGLVATGNSISPSNGQIFNSTLEHNSLPIFGVQFHPEKVQFCDSKAMNDKVKLASEFSQYLASFFVEECKGYDKSRSNDIDKVKNKPTLESKYMSDNLTMIATAFTEDQIKANIGDKFMAYRMTSNGIIDEGKWKLELYFA